MHWILVHGFGPVSRKGVDAVLSVVPARVVHTSSPVRALALIAAARPRSVIVNTDCPYALIVVCAACRPARTVVRCSTDDPEMIIHRAGCGEPRVVPLTEFALIDAVRSAT